MDDLVMSKPTYWAVLPAEIRYDVQLPPNAKLLYAEISSLTDRTGFCWASNAYFEQLYGLSERTIIRLLQALAARGYIRIEDNSGGSAQRRLYAGINPLQGPPDKNVSTPLTEMSAPPDKNVTHTRKYTKKEEQKSSTEPHGARATAWEPEMFERFWKAYPRQGRKDKASARREWDKLKPDRKLMQIMSAALNRAIASDEWQRGIGIPYACRWLSHHRWEEYDETELPPAAPRQEQGAPAWI